MKTAIILGTAFVTITGNRKDKEKRIHQYAQGFLNIKELTKKYPDSFDLYWTDNTIEVGKEYDPELLSFIDTLPNLKNKKLFFDNELGQKNFGSGVIAAWRKILPDITKGNYSFIIYFEPRQTIVDFSFFEVFLKKPDSYFKVYGLIRPDYSVWGMIYNLYRKLFITGIREVWTGLFSCPPEVLEGYVKNRDLLKMTEIDMPIEVDLYNYLREIKLPFKRLNYLGTIRHDNIQNRDIVI